MVHSFIVPGCPQSAIIHVHLSVRWCGWWLRDYDPISLLLFDS